VRSGARFRQPRGEAPAAPIRRLVYSSVAGGALGQHATWRPEPFAWRRCLLDSAVRNVYFIAIASIALFGTQRAASGQPPTDRLEFEVASVKVNHDNVGGSLARTPGGLTARNAEFTRLIELAFQTRQVDLSRVPEPLRSERFDIVAKASGKISGDRYWEMLRTLLEDRFHIKYHRETRNVSVYALSFAKKGAELGAKISHSADPNCPVNPSGRDFCGVQDRPGWMNGQRVPMPRIAQELSAFAGRPVQDQTGLSGAFDFQLTWTPDQFRSDDGKVKLLNGEPIDPSGPSFFTAIQEQLGLKLESKKGPVEFLVIDHAEQPSEN
jgi:uncharacterized protein (TIGR03435 family)